VAPVPASSPEDLSQAFAAAMNAHDVGAALELWSDDAAIVQPDGRMTRGRDAIAGALQALVDNGVKLHIELGAIFAAGDVATAIGTLTLNGTGHDGRPFAQSSSSVVVYARAADGWRIALDAPWGLPTG
jgi:uncharacterized protein (TIGR02246 family)